MRGELFPIVFDEDGRLDALLRRRYEVQGRYEQLIAQYQHELERIRADLARNPNDHNHLQMEHLYKCRIQDARAKMESQIEEIREEERLHAARLHDHHEQNRQSQSAPRGNLRNMLMYGFQGASAMPA